MKASMIPNSKLRIGLRTSREKVRVDVRMPGVEASMLAGVLPQQKHGIIL